jgi:hypothetical protein
VPRPAVPIIAQCDQRIDAVNPCPTAQRLSGSADSPSNLISIGERYVASFGHEPSIASDNFRVPANARRHHLQRVERIRNGRARGDLHTLFGGSSGVVASWKHKAKRPLSRRYCREAAVNAAQARTPLAYRSPM